MKSSNSKISYDLLPAHSDEAIEALTLKVISHLRAFMLPSDRFARVSHRIEKNGFIRIEIHYIALFLTHEIIQTDKGLAWDFIALKQGESSNFLTIILDVAGRLPDDLVKDRIQAAGIRWMEHEGEIYLSDKLSENQLSEIILDRFGDSQCDQK